MRFWSLLLLGMLLICPVRTNLADAPPAGSEEGLATFYLPVIMHNCRVPWRWDAASPVLTANPAPGLATSPVGVIDRSGTLHVFWGRSEWSQSGAFIYHAALTTSGWTAPEPIRPTLGVSYSPALPLVDPDGTIHLLWLNKLTSSGPVRLLHSAYNGSSWSDEEAVFSYPTSASQPSGALQVDRDGTLYAIVQYNHYDSVLYQARKGAGGWQARLVPDTSLADIDMWALGDRDGGVRRFVSRYEGGDYRGYYSYWLDAAFRVTDAPFSPAPHGRAGDLDDDANLHVYWTESVPVPGGVGDGVFNACFGRDLRQLTPPQLLTARMAVTPPAVSAADDSGRWSLAWRLAESGQVEIAVWRGCQLQVIELAPLQGTPSATPIQAMLSRTPNRWCGLWDLGYDRYAVRCADVTLP